MTHPYSTIEFSSSLAHIGEPIAIPEWGTTVLRRQFGKGFQDAVGTYPIAVLKSECDLRGGLDRLAHLGLVSIVLVVDDILRPELEALRQAFDFVRPFKLHYLYDRDAPPIQYSRNHRYKIGRATRAVNLARFDLTSRLGEWSSLYQSVVERHRLERSMHAFLPGHHEAVARLPGAVAIGAFTGERLVSCHIWICHQGHAMSHLVASNDEGYASRAAYAVNAASIELLGDCRTLNFGGAAGAGEEENAADGLARFKRGFANRTAPAYLCGKVLSREAYGELSRQAGVPIDAPYFPAYRQPGAAAADYGMTSRRLELEMREPGS